VSEIDGQGGGRDSGRDGGARDGGGRSRGGGGGFGEPGKRTLTSGLSLGPPRDHGEDAVSRLETNLDVTERSCIDLDAAIEARDFDSALLRARSVAERLDVLDLLERDAEASATGREDLAARLGAALARAPTLKARAKHYLSLAPEKDPSAGAFTLGVLGVGKSPRYHTRRERWLTKLGAGAAPGAGGGSTVPEPVRGKVERATGADLSGVSVNTGSAGAAVADAHDARAVAIGQTIHVGAGEDLHGPAGQHLLAHEVAHTLQAKNDEGAAPNAAAMPRDVTAGDSAAEVEAETFAHAITDGQTPPPPRQSLGGAVAKYTTPPGNESGAPTVAEALGPAPLPGPVILDVLGDRFEVELMLIGGVPKVRIQYVGAERTTVDGATTRVAFVPLLDPKRPLKAAPPRRAADTITFDLYGDGSDILEIRDSTDTSTLDERQHWFWVSDNRRPFGFPKFAVQLPEAVAGDSAAARKPDATGERAIAVPLVLNGDAFQLGARRFGDSKQMLLALKGPKYETQVLVPIASDLRLPGLRVLQNDGRNISIDLDGDGAPDATLIHTVAVGRPLQHGPDLQIGGHAYQQDQARTHYLDVYDAGAIRVGALTGLAIGFAKNIPDDQQREKTPPPMGEAQPVGSAPVQSNVAAEQALAIRHESHDWELRFDGNGDRDKELLLRVAPKGPAIDGQPRTYELSLADVNTNDTSGGQTVTMTPEQWGWFELHGPRQTVVTDGIAATEIAFVPQGQQGVPPLWLELRPQYVTPSYEALIQPTNERRFFFVKPAQAQGTLTDPQGGDNVDKVADILSVEMELGEYHDRFRFAVEETPRSTWAVIFSVTALGPGPNLGGFGYYLAGRNKVSLKKVFVGATSIGFDTDGDGEADLVIYDAISAPMDRVAESREGLDLPERDRDHRMRVDDRMPNRGPHASQIPAEPYTFRIRDGKLTTGYDKNPTQQYAAGAGQSVGLLKDQGAGLQGKAALDQTSVLQQQINIGSALVDVARKAMSKPELGPAGAAAGAAWVQLYGDMNFIDSHRSVGVPPERVASARAATSTVLQWLRTQTDVPNISLQYSQQNPYTGEATTKTAGSAPRTVNPAYGTMLLGDLGAHKFDAALASYQAMGDGVYQWANDQISKDKGADSPEAKQLGYARDMAGQLREIGAHDTAFRVPGTFIADDSYSKLDGFSTYHVVPMQLFVWREGSTWYLRDLTTNAKKPFKAEAEASEYEGDRPPVELFQQLNNAHAYPKGIIRYQMPDGRAGNAPAGEGHGGSVVCDEQTGWAEFLSAISTALMVVGLVSAVVGLEPVAALAFYGSAATGAAAGALAIEDAVEHGYDTPGLILLNVVQIAANLASMGVMSAGKVITEAAEASKAGAAWTGAAARVAQIAKAAYVPLVATEVAANTTTLLIMTIEMREQLEEIDKNVPEGERTAAKARLIAQFGLMGGLTLLSIKGELPQVWRKSPIVIDRVNNVLVARGVEVEIGNENVNLDNASANAHATGRWASEELAEAQTAPDSPRGRAASDVMATTEGQEALSKWLGQEHKLDDHGHVIPPKGAKPEVVAALQRYAETTDLALTERAFATADELAKVREAGADLDIDPHSPTWKTTRERVIALLGGDAKARRLVAAYERARMGVGGGDLGGFIAERARITQAIPESELERLRKVYPESEVYLGGELGKPGQAFDPTRPIEMTVVAPEGTPPEMMYAMEQRLQGYEVSLDPSYIKDHPDAATSVRVRVKVVTGDQFFGLATSGGASFHKVEGVMPDLVGGGKVRAIRGNEYAADAGDLASVHKFWAERGGTESVSKIEYDAATGDSHFEIEVGHGGGKQVIKVSAHLAPRITSAAELISGKNQPVGSPLRSAGAADEIMRDLAAGKLDALAKVGVHVAPGTELPAGVEFGIGKTARGEYVVVRGEGAAVDWERLPGLEPGHTHPSVKGNDIPIDDPAQRPDRFDPETGAPRIALADLINEHKGEPVIARDVVFPSAADIGLMARLGIGEHRVFTPFIVRDGFVMKPPAGDASPRLEFVIRKAREVGGIEAEGKTVYEATVVGEVHGEVVAHETVWAVEPTAGDGYLSMQEPAGMTAHDAAGADSQAGIGDGLKPGQTLYTVRADLEQAVAVEMAKLPTKPEIQVMPADDFAKQYGSQGGRAVYRPGDGGHDMIYARPDARRIDILDELAHAEARTDKVIGPEMLRLEGTLGKGDWKELSVRDRIDAFRRKLVIEIDAKHQLLRGLTDHAEKAEVTEQLAELQRLQTEVEGFSDLKIAKMSAGAEPTPQYLEDPAWLFSKTKNVGDKPSRAAVDASTPTVVLPNKGPEASAAYNTRDNVASVSRVGNQWTESMQITSDHAGTVSMGGDPAKGQTLVITTPDGATELYPLDPGATVRVTDGKTVEPGTPLADQANRQYRLVKIEFTDGKTEMREEIQRANGDGWVQRGSESTRRGGLMEDAARLQVDARLKTQGVEGARHIEHTRGGGGFDDVIVILSGSERRPRAKILIREVKDYPDRYVPIEEFTAIRPPGLGANLARLDEMVNDAITKLDRGEAVPPDFDGMSAKQLAAISSAIKRSDLSIEIVLGPTTKVGREGAKGSSVLADLRREIAKDRGKDVLARTPGGYEAERVDQDFVNEAVKAEKDKP
jgi:hypothetical protein